MTRRLKDYPEYANTLRNTFAILISVLLNLCLFTSKFNKVGILTLQLAVVEELQDP